MVGACSCSVVFGVVLRCFGCLLAVILWLVTMVGLVYWLCCGHGCSFGCLFDCWSFGLLDGLVAAMLL